MKCGNKFPKKIVIDGKERNLQTRKFCFECSPFGSHNTRNLIATARQQILKPCPDCKQDHTQKGRRCFACYFQIRQAAIVSKVQNIVGTRCWFCAYDKCWRNLAFHHVDSSAKEFGLTTRELVGKKWKSVLAEIKKCVLCCHNCHGEIHEGIIHSVRVDEMHREVWKLLSLDIGFI